MRKTGFPLVIAPEYRTEDYESVATTLAMTIATTIATTSAMTSATTMTCPFRRWGRPASVLDSLRMRFERRQRHQLQRLPVGRRQHDARGAIVAVGFQPARCAQAPAV